MLIKKTEEEIENENNEEEVEDEVDFVSADQIADQEEKQREALEKSQNRHKEVFEKVKNIFSKKKEKAEDSFAHNLLEEKEEIERKKELHLDPIQECINIAMDKGIEAALTQLKKEKPFNPYSYDDFHDRLIDEIKKRKESNNI